MSMIEFEQKMKVTVDTSIGEQISKLTSDKRRLEEEAAETKGK
jgi:hypothetical protein